MFPEIKQWWYDDARVWEGFLWDLRQRSQLIGQQLGIAIDAHSTEDLQFEGLMRMGHRVSPDFHEAFEALLDADAAVSGRQLSYEIVASAARHGIKVARTIAAVEPNRYVFEPGSSQVPTFTVFSGANDGFLLEVATDPALLAHPEGYEANSKYHAFLCRPPTCQMHPIPQADDRENLRYVWSMPSGVYGQLVSDPSLTTSIFYKVTTMGVEGEPDSVIRGAGSTWLDEDLPAVFVLPASGGGCVPVCAVTTSELSWSSSASLLVFLLAVWASRRRAS